MRTEKYRVSNSIPLAAVTFPIIGKKWSLVALAIPFIGGWLLLCFAQSVAMLLIGRWNLQTEILKLIFLLSGSSRVSLAELSCWRPRLTLRRSLRRSTGELWAPWCSWWSPWASSSSTWTATPTGKVGTPSNYLRSNWLWLSVLSGVCITFPALLAGWMIFMPRSPIFLVSKGNVDGARKSLQWLRGRKDVDEELKTLQDNVQESSLCGVPLLSLFTKKQYAKPLGIVLVLMALQQLSGINYVLSYSAPIFKVETAISLCLF